MRLLKLLMSVTVASATLLAAAQARADQLWQWSYTGTGVTASGTFTTAGLATSAEPILSITGQRNGMAILGLVPLDAEVPFTFDNLFAAAGPHFTEGGLLYDVGGGETGIINLYYWEPDGTLYDLYVVGNDAFEVPVTFTVTAVPEAATLAMMGLGLAGLAFVVRRTRRRDGSAAAA